MKKWDEEDFTRFDPKIYWSKTNNEIIDLKITDAKTKKRENDVLDLLKNGLITAFEIAEKLEMSVGNVYSVLKNLRRKGCVISAVKMKSISCYSLVSRPNIIHFDRGMTKKFRKD